ncbi:MAG: D-threitol dehydrogenase [Gammaproteobacteria bacterium]
MEFSFATTFDLRGHVALVTGAASGIGKAIATLFAERGATLALVDRNPAIDDTARALGDRHIAWVADVTDERAAISGVADVAARLGRIDVLVNNAGVGGLAKAEETTAELWDMIMAVNLRGPFLYAREVGKQMLKQGGGRIINIASQAALVALEGHLAYCASKSGLLGLTRVLALEWGGRGITVNAISPTVVETELGRISWAGEVGAAFKKKIPTGRFAQPEEIALAALFLASGAAAMINGANLSVDGGYTIL